MRGRQYLVCWQTVPCMTIAKTAGWARQSWSTARRSWCPTDIDMGYIDILLLFSGLPWHLEVVPVDVAPNSGLCSWQITPRGSLGPLFSVWLWCTPVAILVWESVRPHAIWGWLWPGMPQSPCAAHPACIHTPAWYSTVGQPRCYIALKTRCHPYLSAIIMQTIGWYCWIIETSPYIFTHVKCYYPRISTRFILELVLFFDLRLVGKLPSWV